MKSNQRRWNGDLSLDCCARSSTFRRARLLCVAALYLAVGLTLFAGASRQAAGAIMLVDNGSLFQSDIQANTNSFTVSSGADALVVEMDWRTQNTPTNAPTVTYDGITMLVGAQQLGTNPVFVDSAIYYLYTPPTGSNILSVNFNNSITDGAIDAFTLAGVDTSKTPIAETVDNEASVTSLSFPTAFSGIANGSWAAITTDYRDGANTLLNSSVTTGSGTLVTGQPGNGGTAGNGSFWDVNTDGQNNTISAGLLVSDITNSSLNVTETNGGAAGTHWTMAGAVFAPAPAVVPEPSSLLLACIAAVGLIVVVRKRRVSAAT